MSNTYLSVAERAEKVKKYVSLDGRGCEESEASGVPCIAPHQNDPQNPGEDHEVPGQAHVEIATSPEVFAMQYKFFVGKEPKVVDIVRQEGPVTISGRAVDFPANTGREDVSLKIWEVEDSTGERLKAEPHATFSLKADGDWGPVDVNPDAHYEFEIATDANDSFQHFYMQRFLRNSRLVRLLSGDPATSRTSEATNRGPNHSAVVILRMREWYALEDDDIAGDERDKVEISVKRAAGDVAPVNVLRADIDNDTIALHVHDDTETPKESSLEELSVFASDPLLQPFQGSVDFYMPAADPPDGTITVKNTPRGDAGNPQALNFPNWASDKHFINLMFSDYAQPR